MNASNLKVQTRTATGVPTCAQDIAGWAGARKADVVLLGAADENAAQRHPVTLDAAADPTAPPTTDPDRTQPSDDADPPTSAIRGSNVDVQGSLGQWRPERVLLCGGLTRR